MATMKDLVNELGRAKAAEQAWLRKSEAEAQKNRGGTLYNAWARQGPVDVGAYRNTMGGNPHASKIEQLAGQIRQMRAGGGSATTQSASSAAPGGVNLGGLEGLLGAYQSMRNSQMPSLSDQLSYEFQQKLEQANAANQARYDQGLGELTDLRSRSMADLEGVGQQQSADIDRNFRSASGQVQQDLSRRGLLGTSRVASETRRLEEGRAGSQNRLAEQLAMARIGADQSMTNNLTGWIERRNDTAPEMQHLMALQQGLGSSGMQGSTAYGGGMPLGAGGAGAPGGLAALLAQSGTGGAGRVLSAERGLPGTLPGGIGGLGGAGGYGQPADYPKTAADIDPNRVLYSGRDPVMSKIQTLLTQQLGRMTGAGGQQMGQQQPMMAGPRLNNSSTAGARPMGQMNLGGGGGMMMGAPLFAGSGQFSVPGMAMGQMPQMMPRLTSNYQPGMQPQQQALPTQVIPTASKRRARTGGRGYGVSTPTIQNPSMYA